ncbi:MAG: hypothetical protein H6509_03570 [Bryobacterales bacterium]|nr:hypothetical protein [Acidobacteriota bacterium]MCB9383669.1 hypothetical protein [Bryobacterales bacterium]
MQAPTEEIPPPGLILDTGLGESIDGVLALALLYGASDKKGAKVRLASVSISRPDLGAAAFAEALGGFYSDIANREIPERFRRRRSLPVGLRSGSPSPTPAILAKPLAEKNAEGQPLYPNEIHEINDTAEVPALIRNALTAYHDQNCVVALTGPASNLADVLEVSGAKSWIETKARFLAVAIGSFDGSAGADPHAAADVAAARKVFEQWPSPIVAVGREIGDAVAFPSPDEYAAKLGWTEHHLVLDSYRLSGVAAAKTWAMAATLYAASPEEGYFKLSEPGVISIGSDGRAEFHPGGHGRHRYLIFDPEQKQRLADAYLELASAEPAPRELPGFLKRIIEEQKQKEAEEAAKKEQPSK